MKITIINKTEKSKKTFTDLKDVYVAFTAADEYEKYFSSEEFLDVNVTVTVRSVQRRWREEES